MKWENSLQMVMYLIKMCPQKNVHKNVYTSFIHNGPKLGKKKQLQSSKDSAQFLWGNV